MHTMILKFSVLLILVLSFKHFAAGVGGGGDGKGGDDGKGGGGGKGDGGGNGGGSCGGSKVKVTISFDSLDSNSINFMKSQVKQAFDELKDCVEWDFVPCSTSHIVDDVLHCKDGVLECKIDALHACASHFYEKEPEKAGKFFLCMMSCGNQASKGEQCACEAGMDWNKLKGCKPCNEAGTYCDNRWKKLNMLHEPNIPGVLFDWKYDECVENSAMNDLKGTICQQIQKQNKQCPACGSSGGGGGGGGGSKGGGPGGAGGNPGGHGDGNHGSGSPGGHGGGDSHSHGGSGGGDQGGGGGYGNPLGGGGSPLVSPDGTPINTSAHNIVGMGNYPPGTCHPMK